MNTIKPPRLQKGDTIGVCAPSQSVNDRLDRFQRSIPILEQELGVKIKLSPHALGEYHYSAGTLEERVGDFHELVADPEIKAVFFAVGGYTAVELIEKLDYDLIKANPKIITGISDCTTLLNPIYARTGLITFHGLEFSSYGHRGNRPYELASIKQTFFNGKIGKINPNPNWRDWRDTPTTYKGWQNFRDGKATGQLVGGNVASLLHSTNTPYSPSFDNSLLFLEAYKHDKRAIHARLTDLRLRGVLDQISGLIIGYCVGSDNPDKEYNSRPLRDVVLEVTKDYTFPIMQVGEIGHYVENAIIPIGAKATIDTKDLSFTIDETVVT